MDAKDLLRKNARLEAIRHQVDVLAILLVALAFMIAVLVVPAIYTSGASWWEAAISYIVNLTLGLVACTVAFMLLIISVVLLAAVGAAVTSRRKIVNYGGAFDEYVDLEYTLIGASIITVLLAYTLTRGPDPRTPIEAGLRIGAWGIYIFSIFVLILAIETVSGAIISGRLRTKHPDGRLVVGIVEYLLELPEANERAGNWKAPYRKKIYHKLGSIASEFEQYWPKRVGTPGHPDANETALHWAREVAADLYDKQLPLLLGMGTSRDHKDAVGSTLEAFAKGDSSAFPHDVPEGEATVAAWWLRLGQMLLILATIIIAIGFIIVAIIQPDLPDQFSKLRPASGLQPPQLLAVAAGFLGLAAKLIAPGGSPSSVASGKRIRR